MKLTRITVVPEGNCPPTTVQHQCKEMATTMLLWTLAGQSTGANAANGQYGAFETFDPAMLGNTQQALEFLEDMGYSVRCEEVVL